MESRIEAGGIEIVWGDDYQGEWEGATVMIGPAAPLPRIVFPPIEPVDEGKLLEALKASDNGSVMAFPAGVRTTYIGPAGELPYASFGGENLNGVTLSAALEVIGTFAKVTRKVAITGKYARCAGAVLLQRLQYMNRLDAIADQGVTDEVEITAIGEASGLRAIMPISEAQPPFTRMPLPTKPEFAPKNAK